MSNRLRLAALSPQATDEGAVFAVTDFGWRRSRIFGWRKSRVCSVPRHGFCMPKLGVVESGICRGSGGFGRWVERFVGFGLLLGCGVFFALWVQRVLDRR